MSDSIKRIFLFLLMFIVVISLTTLASSLQIKEVEIIFSDGTKTHLTVSANKTAEEILKDVRKAPRKNISPDHIINACSDFYSIRKDDILSSTRKKEVVQARNIAIYLCRELTNLSFPAIGQHFNKDHTSILYSFNKIAKLNEDEFPDIFENISMIKEKLGQI